MKRHFYFAVLIVGALTGSLGSAPSCAQNAYIPNNLDNTVSVIDTGTNTLVGSPIPVGVAPSGVAVTPAGRKVYVSNFNDNTVSVIDTLTNAVITTIPLSRCPGTDTDFGAIGVAASPDGKKVYVANVACSVSVIDTATDTVTATIMIHGDPFAIAVTPDGSKVYVVGERGAIWVITTATNTVTAEAGLPWRLRGVAVSPDGRSVYIPEGPGLAVLDTATDTVVEHIAVGSVLDRFGVAVTPNGKKIYFTNGDSVSVVDAVTNTVVGSPIAVGSQAYGVAITPDGSRVYVANELDNTVSVIDAASSTAVTALPVGSGPTALGVFIQPRFAGTPGTHNCHGMSISTLAKTFGGLDAAAKALGFPTVEALQAVVDVFCQALPGGG